MSTSVIPHDRLHILRDEIERSAAIGHHPEPATTPIMSTRMQDLDHLGRMSAEAVLAQYEAAAKSVEEMGTTVRELVKRLGQSMIECDNDMRVVAETAAAIRDKGKHTEALIEQVSDMSKHIRDTCVEFKRRVGA